MFLATTDKLQLVTDAAGTIDFLASYADYAAGAVSVNRSPSVITTATTTDVVAAPGASTTRHVKEITARNRHASQAVTATLLFHNGATPFHVWQVALAAGEQLYWSPETGLLVQKGNGLLKTSEPEALNASVADQSIGASTIALLTGSVLVIPTARLRSGTVIRYHVVMSKTAAATAAQTFDVRFGTAGTTSDASRHVFSTGTQTAAADVAEVEITVVVRGPIGATCVTHGAFELQHNLASTGFATTANVVSHNASAAFDITAANLKVGLSTTTGTSHAVTVQQVIAQILNLA